MCFIGIKNFRYKIPAHSVVAGKFFYKKAAFISRKWFSHFANYRRDGYDFDARFEDELASYQDKRLYDLIEESAPILSKELKRKGNYKKTGNKGFDSIITRLQEQGYVLISDFVYQKDRYGKPYGWGVAEYSAPEAWLGKRFQNAVYKTSPEESYRKMMTHLKKLLPKASEEQIRKLLR